MQADDKVRLRDALERLVQLYTGWGQPEKAVAWKEKLEAFDTGGSAARRE